MKLFPRSNLPGANPQKNSCSTQRGFQLLELIIVLGALVGLMGMFSKHLQRELQQTANQAVAHQLRQVTRAAYQYAKDNYLSLSGATSPSITLQKLLDEGYLNRHLPQKNLYDQGYNFEVTPSDPAVALKSLQILVTTTGGRTIDEDSIRVIASKVGGEGGYSSITMPGKIIGSSGGWEVNVPGIKDGHLASLTVVNEKDVMANYYVSNGEEDLLHRVKVDGHPEYNKMETDLEIADYNSIFFGENSVGDPMSTLSGSGVSFYNLSGSRRSLLTSGQLELEDKIKSNNRSVLSSDSLMMTDSSNGKVTLIKKDKLTMFDTPQGAINSTVESGGFATYKDKNNYSVMTPDCIETASSSIVPDGVPISLTRGSLGPRMNPFSFRLPVYLFNNLSSYPSKLATSLCKKYGTGHMFLAKEDKYDNDYAFFVCISDKKVISIDSLTSNRMVKVSSWSW